ncbi:MAG: YiiD C-terminal domain-containing protein [Pirellulales bacterium]|nr:YiiD C-terminal domain-containing protein [Pirellulales bacterium]
MADPLLIELQQLLDREIPICQAMGIQVHSIDENGLTMQMPLDINRNHQRTAFAGSLNALCTITGWGTMVLLARPKCPTGGIVIRRSSIRYLEPIESSSIRATCAPAPIDAVDYFLEMLCEKGQAKLELRTVIPGQKGPAVIFNGSYVVISPK